MPRLSFGTDLNYHERDMFFKGYGLLIFSVSNRQLLSPLIFRFARKHRNINIFDTDKTINTVHLLVSIFSLVLLPSFPEFNIVTFNTVIYI